MSSSASTSGPAAAGPAPTSTSSGPAPAHPAFPALIPSNLRTAPVAPSIPTTASQILKLIQTCNSPHSISTSLIPSLAAVASAKKAPEKDREKAMGKGEEILALFNEDLRTLKEDDVHRQAAGLVFVVSARLHPNHADQPEYNADLLQLAVNLCHSGNSEQLHQCGPRLADLAWGMVRLAKKLRTLDHILPALQRLIERTTLRQMLSGVHAAYLEACLITQHFDAARFVVDAIYVDVKTMSLSYLDVITFYHHAGLISAALGNYAYAVEMFSTAVTVPTTAASAIQLACAKRAILCGILDDGKLIHFSKYIAGSVTRLIDRNAKDYVKLAEAFMSANWNAVRGFIGNKEFKDDCNVGLLYSIISSIPIRQIIRLKSLYSRMTLGDLAQRLDYTGEHGQGEVLAILQYMVNNRIIRAAVDDSGPSPIVSFMEEDTDYTSPSALAYLKQLNHTASWLEMELTKSGRELGVNREYLKKQAQSLDNPGKGGGGAKGGADDMDDFMSGAGMPMGRGGAGKMKMKGVGSNMADMGF